MIAALLEVHDNVEQRNLVSSSSSVQRLKVACQNKLVVFSKLQNTKLIYGTMKNNVFPQLSTVWIGFNNKKKKELCMFKGVAYFCMGLSSTRTMSSVFEGMCLNTSAFNLLSMCGPSMSWSFLIWSSLAMSANSSRNPSRLLQI